ncbi:ABC transporter ATP-binding protein [Actinoplanes sp. NPDC004185]
MEGPVHEAPAVVPGAVDTDLAAHEPGAAVLTVRDIVKRYGSRTAVDGVSFTLGAGECFGLLGPNGAGKTTTILMICGLLAPDAGTITLGADGLPAIAAEARRAVGYVPQEIALYDDLTGRENLRFFAALYGLGRKAARSRTDELLEMVDLAARGADRVATYSGGMKRRLNIAVALLHRPALLILDEPTVGVDPQSRNAILSQLERLRDDGLALLYSSHYMAEVERLATRIGIIDEGRLLTVGTRAELVGLLGNGLERVRLSCPHLPARTAAELAAVEAVTDVRAAGGTVEIAVDHAASALPEILTVLARSGVVVADLSVEQPNLETVFLHLTGRALRDG